MKRILYLLLIAGLAACSTGNVKPGDRAQIGDYYVTRSEMTPLNGARADGLNSLFFTFSFAEDTPNANGLTEADWAREAELMGTSVDIAKRVIDERSAYKTKSGRIALCTVMAIDKGLCGRKLNLSVAQRAEMAEAMLAQSSRCQ